MKIRLVPLEEKYHILLIMENILDKIKVGDATSKWNYSYMLIKTLSHELVTPLHHLLIYSNQMLLMINQEKLDKETQQQKMLSVKQIGMCLYFTVKNMLDYANIINHTFDPKFNKFYVKEVLLAIVEAFSSKAKKQGIQLKFECDSSIELVSDKERLTGLIFIFVDNSMRFTKKGGILIQAQRIRNKVVFKVIDSGSGIENSDLAIIKDIINNPFLEDRTQNSAGLGIGFRIAQHLYKKMSGSTIEINSEVGYGTTIQFEIPQYAEKAYSKISSTISNKSRTNEIIFNAHIDMESEKQTEFRKERTTAFGEIAKAILQASKITPKHLKDSEIESRLKPLGCIEEEKTYQLKQNSSFTQNNLDFLSNRQLDSMNSMSDDDKFDYQKPYIESPWIKHEKNDLISQGDVLESCRSPTPIEGELSHRPDDPNSKWALIVDDDAFNNDIAKNMLISLGCSVYSADGGDATISLCEELLSIVPVRKLDIVFMDYYMPDKSGCETTRVLREPRFDPILKDTPIIGLTANCDQETVTACLKAGMNLVESKPCDLDKIRGLLVRFNILSS